MKNYIVYFVLFLTLSIVFASYPKCGISQNLPLDCGQLGFGPDQPACVATPGCLGGNAFEDYNCNGIADECEYGAGGVQVAVYDCDNIQVGTATTDGDGDWQLCGLTDGNAYRVEFILPETLACWATPTHAGSENGTDVQFLTAPACTKFSISNPYNYCQANPLLVLPCYINGDPLQGGTASGEDAIVTLSYDGVTKNVVATTDQVGSVWGVAQKGSDPIVYSGAVLKRHTGFGPLGIGGIYATDLNTGTTTNFIDLSAIGVNVGADPRNPTDPVNTLPADKETQNQDSLAFHLIGYAGIGDIDVSDDGNTLWFTNLNDKNLYRVDLSGGMPTAADVSNCNLPNPCGSTGEAIPWGVTYYKGAVYVGGICNAIISQNRADLLAYVYKVDDNCNVAQVTSFPLDYTKGNATGYDCDSDRWYPWVTDWSQLPGALDCGGTPRPTLKVYPQPILTDIEFVENGDMVLGFLDRTGLQVGTANMDTDGNLFNGQDFGGFSAMVGGDILRVSFDNAGLAVLESNGTAGNLTSGGAGNNEGPGGGEFYFGEAFINHDETSLGGLAVLPGTCELVSSTYDALAFDSGGLEWLNNTTGDSNKGYTIYATSGNDGTFAKGVGLGDVEIGCTAMAPLEIGNYVWCDSIFNGIQDACELAIDGMNVELYDVSGTLVGVTTTANGGQYFFNETNVDINGVTTDGSPTVGFTGMDYSSQYFIVYGNGQFANGEFTVGTETYGITALNDVNANANDNVDSDIDPNNLTSGGLGSRPDGLPQISLTTDATGCANHRFDLGVTCCPEENCINQYGEFIIEKRRP